MQIMPLSVKPTVETPKPQSGWVSKRRLFFLVATAAVASSLGMALGGSFRFQVVNVGQTPLFKPQQDFPPLAEWPPEVPSAQELDHQEPSWDEAPPPQLVYNEWPTDDEVENNDVYEQVAPAPEEPISQDILPSQDMIDAETSSIENTPQNFVDGVSEGESLVPVISTSTGNLDEAPVDDEPLLAGDTPPERGNGPQFSKQPASEAQFIDSPHGSAPEEPIPSPALSPID